MIGLYLIYIVSFTSQMRYEFENKTFDESTKSVSISNQYGRLKMLI